MNEYIVTLKTDESVSFRANAHLCVNGVYYFATNDICDRVIYNVASITQTPITPTSEELLEIAQLKIKSLEDKISQLNNFHNNISQNVDQLVYKLKSQLQFSITLTSKSDILKTINRIQDITMMPSRHVYSHDPCLNNNPPQLGCALTISKSSYEISINSK